MSHDRHPTYWDYLRVPELLGLQGGLTGEESDVSNDELLFIVVHQAYELWFKLVLSELRGARDRLLAEPVSEEEIPRVVDHVDRAVAVLRLAGNQFELMETLSPQGFLAFRDRLAPASGFQSVQMREIEIVLGLAAKDRIALDGSDPLDHLRRLAQDSPSGAAVLDRLAAAAAEPTLKEALSAWLHRTPIRGSRPGEERDDLTVETFLADCLKAIRDHHETLLRRLAKSGGSDPDHLRERFRSVEEAGRRFLSGEDAAPDRRDRIRRVRAAILFIESYRELPLLAWPRVLLDRVVVLEQQFLLWRNRHARMVERMIGRRVGTGGSSGVDYLDETTRYRVFTDLWEVRTLLLPEALRPHLPDANDYGFRC